MQTAQCAQRPGRRTSSWEDGLTPHPTAQVQTAARDRSGHMSTGPTPGSTTSADSAAAPTAAAPASTPTLPWPRPSSPSVRCAGPPGSSTAGTPDHDQDASADLLAEALIEQGLLLVLAAHATAHNTAPGPRLQDGLTRPSHHDVDGRPRDHLLSVTALPDREHPGLQGQLRAFVAADVVVPLALSRHSR